MSLISLLAPAANSSTPSLPDEFYYVSSVSKISGILSLSVWLFAQLPQVLENYINQSVSGVSVAFLACWVCGDFTNLTGCILTRALPFQTCLAAYYCFIDFILMLQYWYYTRVYPRQAVHHNMLQSPNMMRPVKSSTSVKGVLHSRLNRFEASPKSHSLSAQRSNSSERRPRKPRRSFLRQVLSGSVISSTFGKASARPVSSGGVQNRASDIGESLLPIVHTIVAHFARLRYSSALVGTLSGWLSTCFYVTSRLPQIWKNHCSKSTTGISPFLFLFAMTGNILYTVSISSDLYLLSKYDEYLGSADFHSVLSAQMPFLVGSSGTVIFDAVLLFQFWLYKKDPWADPKQPALQVTSSSPKEMASTDMHFTTPDWYTNNFNVPAESGFSYEDRNPSHDTRNRILSRPGERTRLVHDAYIISPPSHYVISSAQSSVGPQPKRRGLSGTFSALANSVSKSPSKRPPSATFPNSMTNSSAPGTALLPSLVGSYSSISKKMAHDSRVPFSPIDFLHDDFLHRSSGSANDSRTGSSSRF